MPKFFCDDIREDHVVFSLPDKNHILKSLRMKEGDIITVCDLKGYDYNVRLRIENSALIGEIIEKHKNDTEPESEIILFQALPKGDKLELIIQKATELGISEIVPFESEFCTAKINEKTTKKISRLNKIALEAAMQSQRGKAPKVKEAVGFDEMIKYAGEAEKTIFFYEEAKEPLSELFTDKKYKKIAFIIGSEGGFSKNEAEKIKQAGFSPASLGKRILRCETAAISALSIIMYLNGEI